MKSTAVASFATVLFYPFITESLPMRVEDELGNKGNVPVQYAPPRQWRREEEEDTSERRRLEKSCAILVVQAPESRRIDVAASCDSQIDDDCIASSKLWMESLACSATHMRQY